VALLRHYRTAGRKGIAEPDKAEGVARPDDDLLRKARQMRPGQRRGGEKLDREIAVGDGIDRVRGRAVEAERGSGPVAVDRKSGAGERGGAERGFIEAAAAVGEAATVAPEHLDIGHQMVAESHWLRDLQMRKAGHDAIGMCLGLTEKRALTFPERGIEAVDCVANPETKIGRRLIVARLSGVYAARGRPDQLGEPRLDIEVDVLVLVAEDKAPHLDLAADLL